MVNDRWVDVLDTRAVCRKGVNTCKLYSSGQASRDAGYANTGNLSFCHDRLIFVMSSTVHPTYKPDFSLLQVLHNITVYLSVTRM